MTPRLIQPERWDLDINCGEWHLAVTPRGTFRIKPHTPIPPDSTRLYPGRLHAWQFFNPDGSLLPKYCDAPVYPGPGG